MCFQYQAVTTHAFGAHAKKQLLKQIAKILQLRTLNIVFTNFEVTGACIKRTVVLA